VRKLAAAFPDKGSVPSACVAIEDTPAGIASATGAGVSVLAVTNSYPADHLVKAASVVPSLQGLSAAHLNALLIK
jgi:beta-phosphoglucomutase